MALARTVLPVPGHVLDEQVAPAQQGDEGEPDLVVLADDDALDVGEDSVAGLLDLASSASLAVWAPADGSGGGASGVDGPRLARGRQEIVRRMSSRWFPGASDPRASCRRATARMSFVQIAAQPRNRVSPPTQAVIRQPIPPMTARNELAADPRRRRRRRRTATARTAAMAASPIRSISGRGSRGSGGPPASAGIAGRVVAHRDAHRVASSQRMRSPAIGAATSPPRPACSTRTAMATCGCLGRREADEPRVRLARAAELGRAGLAGRRHARDLGARP